MGREVEFANLAESHAVLSVIGPAAGACSPASARSARSTRTASELAGSSGAPVATDLGLDLLCRREDVESLSEGLAEAGVERVDDAAAEIARVESGRPRFGREMTTATIPQEAGINERAVSFTKGCYIGPGDRRPPPLQGQAEPSPPRAPAGRARSESGAPIRLGERELGRSAPPSSPPPTDRSRWRSSVARPSPAPTVGSCDGGTVEAAVVELPFV